VYVVFVQRDNGTARCPMCRGDVSVDKLVEVPPETQATNAVADMPWQSSSKVRILSDSAEVNKNYSEGCPSFITYTVKDCWILESFIGRSSVFDYIYD